MLIRATRTLSALTLRAVFYAALFVAVVVVHLALTAALRQIGWNGQASLLASGAVVLAIVLSMLFLLDWLRARRAAARETERIRQGLPDGPCCVIWRGGDAEDDLPWETAGPLRARYPALALRLGVEGVAMVEFEITAQGAAKNIHCVDVWPSKVFYEAAREALQHVRFQPKPGAEVRFGRTYRTPFVFRIAGAAEVQERGRRARRLSPSAEAAKQFVEKLARRA